MKLTEDLFYRQLQTIPDAPDDILPGVMRSVRQEHFTKRLITALAASLVLAVSCFGLYINDRNVRLAQAQELNESLTYIATYFNTSDDQSLQLFDDK